MNVLEVKVVTIDAIESMTFADIELCIENRVHKTACFNVGKIVSATYHLNNGEAKRELNVFIVD